MLQASRVQGPGSPNPPWSNGGDLCCLLLSLLSNQGHLAEGGIDRELIAASLG